MFTRIRRLLEPGGDPEVQPDDHHHHRGVRRDVRGLADRGRDRDQPQSDGPALGPGPGGKGEPRRSPPSLRSRNYLRPWTSPHTNTLDRSGG